MPLAGIVAVSVTPGCARLNSIQRNVDFSKNSITLDAEQRVVISVPVPGDPSGKRIVCAEPNPDVFKVRGSSFSALLDQAGKQDLELALSAAEAGQNIGLRTQSIQLLRDEMYRACEGAADGLITPRQFEELHTRFQKLTAVLLATEQLTGAVRPVVAPILAVGGTANTGVGLVAIQEELDRSTAAEGTQTKAVAKQIEQVATREKALADAKKALAAKPDDAAAKQTALDAETALTTAQTQLASEQKTLATLTENRLALERKRNSARAASTTAEAGAVFVAGGDSYRPIDPQTASVVANTIKDMVTQVFAQDSASQICLRHFISVSERALEKTIEAERLSSLSKRSNLSESDLAPYNTYARSFGGNAVAAATAQATLANAEATTLRTEADAVMAICKLTIAAETAQPTKATGP